MVAIVNGYWPINQAGEIVCEVGSADGVIVGTLNEGFIPVNPITGKVVFQGLGGGGGSYTLLPATSSSLGGVKIDGTTITATPQGVISATPYTLPIATTSSTGGVKVDGTTITISSGVISAVGGGTSKQATTGTLPNSTPVVVALSGNTNAVYLVSTNPQTGDTIRVESGTSSTGPWTVWTNGDVTAADNAYLYPSSPANTHVRFTRVAGTGTTSRYYINEQ